MHQVPHAVNCLRQRVYQEAGATLTSDQEPGAKKTQAVRSGATTSGGVCMIYKNLSG